MMAPRGMGRSGSGSTRKSDLWWVDFWEMVSSLSSQLRRQRRSASVLGGSVDAIDYFPCRNAKILGVYLTLVTLVSPLVEARVSAALLLRQPGTGDHRAEP